MKLLAVWSAFFFASQFSSVAPEDSFTWPPHTKAKVAREVSAYFHDKGIKVNVGAVAVQWPDAIANWQTPDKRVDGQALLRYLCDHWNFWNPGTGKVWTTADLIDKGLPRAKATQLIADLHYLTGLAPKYEAYEPAPPGC